MVVGGKDVTEEQAETIYERELKRVSRNYPYVISFVPDVLRCTQTAGMRGGD